MRRCNMPLDGIYRPRVRSLVSRRVIWLALGVILCGKVLAQAPAGDPSTTAPAAGELRTYDLRHVAAERVRDELASMLNSVAQPGEVVADRQANRVVVRGGPPIQQLAMQVIDSLDRPPAASPTPPDTAQSGAQHVLRAYPMLPSHEPQIAALERQYQGRKDVRFARDARTAQLLVLAPPAIHKEVTQILSTSPNPGVMEQPSARDFAAQPLPATGRDADDGAAAPAAGDGPAIPNETLSKTPPYGNSPESSALSRRVLQLRNLPVDEVHARLEKLTGRPLALHEDPDRVNIQFGVDAAAGSRVSISANRQTGRITVTGFEDLADSWAKVIAAMDAADSSGRNVTRLVAAPEANRDQLRLVAQTLAEQPAQPTAGKQAVYNTTRDDGQLVSMLLQPPGQPLPGQAPPQNAADQQPQVQPPQGAQALVPEPGAAAGLIGPVQIEAVEGTDFLIVRGDARDVERVMRMIEALEQEILENPPQVEILPLQHVQSQAMAALVSQVYENVLTLRLGAVSITPLVKPNALLLIGRPENVETVVELVRRLDQDVPPTTQFEVFLLRHASALDVVTRIDEFFAPPEDAAAEAPVGLAPQVFATADYRSNAVIVRAAPRDMEEVRALIARLDTDEIAATDVVKTFYLRNALAAEVAQVLLNALTAQGQLGAQPGAQPGFQPGGPAAGQQGQQVTQPKSRKLTIVAVDAEGNEEIQTSGILTDIRISPDERSNALVVTAPRNSMDLIAALIAQLDQVPSLEAEVKVFEIENGDAGTLAEVLRELFAQPTGGAAGQQVGPQATPLGAGETSLVPLSFAVDERTNTIIATGTSEDLRVVHAILLTLDEAEVRGRSSRVFKLKNLFAPDVALALTDWLAQEREVQQILPGGISAIEQIEREAVIVPEEASNSLIVSATPQLFRELEAIIAEIDARPPMVMIQVLIAEVSLNDTDEFGVEIGLQDSLLFDRSLLEIIDTTTNVVTETSPGGGMTTVQEEIIQSATIAPGFLFGNPLTSLGNSGSDRSLATAGKVGTQGLTSFGVGRVNGDLGFGGFVFSAGSENVHLLLRALQESRRLEVLSRPQIMALDNQFAVVQVGQLAPIITSSTLTQTGQINTTTFQEVGLILRVQPRVSSDGMVVMRIEAEKSAVGPEEEGIPVSISATGEVVRSPRIDRTFAGTIVQALSGQTIVLGGLISKSTTDVHRRVPLVADIPLLGDLFRYDGTAEQRNELLIIMTPRVVRNYLDAEMIKQVESSRMDWVLSDVVSLHGPSGLRGRMDEWTDADCEAVYPTYVPGEGEMVLPPMEEQPQPTPALGPPPQPPVEEPPDLGRYERIEYETAPAVYHRSEGTPPAARQSAYKQLLPLPPTE